MLLAVDFTPDTLDPFTFTFVVPGDRIWLLRSIVAVCATDAGGQPDRGYTLTITDGTSTVAQVGADDGGTEPATVTITWTNAPKAISAAGNVATSLAPIPNYALRPGYVIQGDILHPVGADQWLSAVAWYEYVPSAR